MSVKTYNYPTPAHWGGGIGPHGEYNSKEFNAYLKDWDEFNAALEKITNLKVTAYDPGVNLTRIDERGNWSTVQLPLWFAQKLVDKFEALNDELVEEINRER
jgi:hypothetical protein